MLKLQTGYYGLQVKPTYEQVLGNARKPLRIPLPDRSAKWYALSPYRAAILDAEKAYQDYEHAALNYRATGDELPESAARVKESPAEHDATFAAQDAHAHERDLHQAARFAADNEAQDAQRQARTARRETLGAQHSHARGNPIISAESTSQAVHHVIHSDDEQIPMPGSQPSGARAPLNLPRADGYGAIPEFTPFRQLNYGDRSGLPARVSTDAAESYETMRDRTAHATWST